MFHKLLAERTEMMGASAIREILKVVSQPGMISMAGGIPAPESFPLSIIRELTDNVIRKYSSRAFQYDLTEGFAPLQEQLAMLLAERGINASPETINITSGSQGVLDAIAKVLISKGDKIAVEAPTYLGALSAFNPYQPDYISIDTDSQGVIPESLEHVLKHHHIKFIYLVPTFQNPTGRTISLNRRKKIAAIIHGLLFWFIQGDDARQMFFQITAFKIFCSQCLVKSTGMQIYPLFNQYQPLSDNFRSGIKTNPETRRKYFGQGTYIYHMIRSKSLDRSNVITLVPKCTVGIILYK